MIDAGTNRQSLLDDPNYLGNRHERVRGDRYYAFIDQFVETVERLFPKLYLTLGRLRTWQCGQYFKQIQNSNSNPSTMIFKEQEL